MTAQQCPQKMIANLTPGERIRFHANELQFRRNNLRGWIEATVKKVEVSREGWHTIVTQEFGRLRAQLPETKHFVICD